MTTKKITRIRMNMTVMSTITGLMSTVMKAAAAITNTITVMRAAAAMTITNTNTAMKAAAAMIISIMNTITAMRTAAAAFTIMGRRMRRPDLIRIL